MTFAGSFQVAKCPECLKQVHLLHRTCPNCRADLGTSGAWRAKQKITLYGMLAALAVLALMAAIGGAVAVLRSALFD